MKRNRIRQALYIFYFLIGALLFYMLTKMFSHNLYPKVPFQFAEKSAFFLHIPKTGGRMFDQGLQEAFRKLDEFRICPIGKDLPMDHVCERHHRPKAAEQVFLKFGNECNYMYTHFDYSLLENINKKLNINKIWSFSMFRDPVERTFSAWTFSSEGKRMRLEEFLNLDTAHAQKYGGPNHMTKQLAGILQSCSLNHDLWRDYLISNPDIMLNVAKRNAEGLDDIFLYKYRDKFKPYLWKKYGLEFELPKKRYNSKRGSKAPNEDQIQLLLRANSLDVSLYQHMEFLWEKQLLDVGM